MENNRLRMSLYGEMFIIDLEQTLYFEADDHYTHVCTASGQKYLMPFGLSDVEAEVNRMQEGQPTSFLRLGRRFIVNTSRIFHINVIKQHVLLADNRGTVHSIQLSKPVLRELMGSI